MDAIKVDADGDNTWNGVEDTIEDPEEARVLFCALDSFL
jgi:carnosine N-methyltransferase